MRKYITLFLLLVILQQVTCPPPGVFNFITEIIATRQNQIRHATPWKHLLHHGEIRETNVNALKYYEFVGPNVQRLKLKQSFYFPQNWLHLSEVGTKAKFTIGIGEQPFDFRLWHKQGNQLLVETGDGTRLPSYNEVFEIIEGVNQKRLAKLMLDSLNRPLNDQPNWNSELSKDITSPSQREEVTLATKMLMTITHVAEAANPLDRTWIKWKKVLNEVSELSTLTEDETQRRLSNDIFEKQGRQSYSSPEQYSELMETLRELNNPINEQNTENLRVNIREMYPPLLESAFLGITEKKTREQKRKEMERLGFDRNALEFETFLTALKKKGYNEQEIMNLLNDVPFSDKTFETLIDISKTRPQDYAEKVYKSEVSLTPKKGGFSKTGRVPGADQLFRGTLELVASDKERSIEDATRKYFPLHEEGGAQKGRLSIFTSYDSVKEPHRHELLKGGAVSEEDTKRVEKELEEALNKRSCERKKRQVSQCKLKLNEESFEWEENDLSFETIDEEGNKQTHKIEVKLDEMKMSDYMKEHISNLKESGVYEVTEAGGKAVGAFGTFVNIFATAHHISNGEYGQAAFTTSQVAHSLGGLTGVNEVVEKVSKRAFTKVASVTAEKVGLKTSLKELSEFGAKALGRTASKVLGRLAGSLPYVGLAFDLYFLKEDWDDLRDPNSPTPLALKITHLGLDFSITVISLIESAFPVAAPILAPISLALTVIRMGIDDFYLDIKEEMEKVKGKGFVAHYNAFFKGLQEGVFDFLTLGLGRQLRQIQQQKEQDNQFLSDLSNPANYFNVTFEGIGKDDNSVGTVDFTAGTLSNYGGFLSLKLNEDGSFTVELPTVTENGVNSRIMETFTFDYPVKDIVLGVGQTVHPEYKKVEANLWLVIPVQSEDVIDRLEEHQSSKYGVYTGNSEDNDFFAVGRKRRQMSPIHKRSNEDCQKVNTSDLVDLYLSGYHYDLYGKEGNDKFFLGPQTSQVSGDEGNDVYFIQPGGGKAVINNFAIDEEMDTLFLNFNYSGVYCYRDDKDLVVGYCDTHNIKLTNWFVTGNQNFYRHISLATKDGIGVEVTGSGLDNNNDHDVQCKAVVIDKYSSTESVNIELSGAFSEVKKCVGSNFSDHIVGNDMSNMITGGLGDDYIEGGNGPDVYIIREGDGIDNISNYAADNMEDTILIGITYTNIATEKNSADLLIYDFTNPTETMARLLSWYTGSSYQHVSFISKEHVRFLVGDDDGVPKKHPINIDLSENEEGVVLDLENENNNINITVDDSVMHEIDMIIDSPYDDILRGNELGNVISCSGGSDILQGNGGKDTYIINPKCKSVIIENYDELLEYDLLLLRCEFNSISLSIRSDSMSNDLILTCRHSQHNDVSNTIIEFPNWFQSAEHQHLLLKTSDKLTALLPESKEEFEFVEGQILPTEIESDEDCGGELRTIYLTTPSNVKAERFVAKTDACSFEVHGNSLGNYIDPGPDNPYGYQHLKGGNGTDTYVIGHAYGTFNEIDNFAEDGIYDHLNFDVVFHDINVLRENFDAVLTSLSRNDSVRVSILNYFKGEAYQHLLIHSADGISFKLQEKFPYTFVLSVDFSSSTFSQIISAGESSSFVHASILIGSKQEENKIEGGIFTHKLVGGNNNDSISGGPGDETIIGLGGDDFIEGGDGKDQILGGPGDDALYGDSGDDGIYGGEGADSIYGGEGFDTVVFSGDNGTGVTVDLVIGIGLQADAEGDQYVSIEGIYGSEYDDALYGNDEDNIIMGFGGSDIIEPAGGYDVVQGGTGSDIYQLDNAFGRTIIDNFATDYSFDVILLNDSSSSQMCYFFLENDLEINFFFDVNTPDAVSRISLAEDHLQITLPSWLKNETYQHVLFSFSDGYVEPEYFTESGRQLQDMFHQIISGYAVEITCVSNRKICLQFNFTAISETIAESSHYQLEYIHINHDSVSNYSLEWINEGGVKYIENNELAAGVEHMFAVKLTSCGLVVGLSPLVKAKTIPTPPNALIASDIVFDGFTLTWNPPSSATDPLVNDYKYIINIWNDEHNEFFEFSSISTSFTTYDLIPETIYKVCVSSLVNNVTSPSSSVITVEAGENICSNLVHLPLHLHISKFSRNSQGNIIANVYCEDGFQMNGHPIVECHSELALPSCELIPCSLPSVNNAVLNVGNSEPKHGETYVWKCKAGYELSNEKESFTSTCLYGEWTDVIQSCQEKPQCSPLEIENGEIELSSLYIDGTISFSCLTGYILNGPKEKVCKRRQDNSAFWDPQESVQCVALACPNLLPQPNGQYSNSGTHYTGDKVFVTCSSGYYIEDDPNTPEEMEMECYGTHWYPEQKHCMLIIECTSITNDWLHIDGTIRYSFSSWYNTEVSSLYYHLACTKLMGGISYLYYLGFNTIRCKRSVQLQLGPSIYEGLPYISTEDGYQYACANTWSPARDICVELGYGGYTSKVYNSHPIDTYYTFNLAWSWSWWWSVQKYLNKEYRSCAERVSCRHRCSYHNLLNGNYCPESFEGNHCYFHCNPGYALIGPSSWTCTGNGWPTNHPFCDGKHYNYNCVYLKYTY